LLVWSLTGIGLFIGWSIAMNELMATSTSNQSIVYSAILIISGGYQFSPLKSKCLGYCESPISFFMRRWKGGAIGAVRMGLYHGLYCLGCCWPYFLLMVALGWMNLLWMGLFAAVIFGEKLWRRGIWVAVARAAGIGLVVVGILVISGVQFPFVSSMDTMGAQSDSGDMAMVDGDAVQSADHSDAMPSNSSDDKSESQKAEPSMGMKMND
jgi:predicted metal-binding membrane protein